MRHVHVIHGVRNPLKDTLWLDLILRGVQRAKPKGTRTRLPVTPRILRSIKSSLDLSPGFDSTMLWAACCTAFFGFMQCAEFTTSSTSSYSSRGDFLAEDVAVHSHLELSVIAIRIKRSKTDQFSTGVTFYLGRTNNKLCPVVALLNYLAHSTHSGWPLICVAGRQVPVERSIGLESSPSPECPRHGLFIVQWTFFPQWCSNHSGRLWNGG